MSAEVVTFANLKGGVGKTTLTYAFISAAVSKGKRVVCLDLDPKASLSNNLSRKKVYPATIWQVLKGTASWQEALTVSSLGEGLPGYLLVRFFPSDRRLKKEKASAQFLQQIIDGV